MSYQPINADSDDDHGPSSLLLQPGGRYELQSTNRLAMGNSYAASSVPSSPTRSPSRSERKKAKYCDVKTVAFFGVGVITLLYCILELGIGGWLGSLALMADGFHNLSDVVSLGIANWANQATKRPSTFDMSFGWARSEILGGLINAVFLLALCLYTSLEAIFEFIEPKPIDASWLYMGTAALGVIINTAGTLIFMATGNAHGHSHGGHGHSHGGDDHGHGHGHGDKKEKHGHGHGDKKEKHGHGHGEKKEKHGHGHGHGEKKEKHGHGHGEKKEKHGHGHGEKKEKHGHGHGEKKEKHGHGHGEKKEKHGHGHGDKKEKHGHGHGHGDKKKEKHGHGHGDDDGHGHSEKKVRRDENVYAVFIHYLGDMISSLLVLCAGILIHFFGGNGPNVCSVTCDYLPNGGETWTLYLDPLTSLIIVGLIFFTSYPIVVRCVWILLQKAPDDMNIPGVRQEILMIDGVVSVHDLHIWQLVDGMVFCSAHIAVQEGISWIYISTAIRRVLHDHGVHSSSIQPEFIIGGAGSGDFCEQNCVDDCAEDWCCKTPAESFKETNLSEIHYEDGHAHSHSQADEDDDHTSHEPRSHGHF